MAADSPAERTELTPSRLFFVCEAQLQPRGWYKLIATKCNCSREVTAETGGRIAKPAGLGASHGIGLRPDGKSVRLDGFAVDCKSTATKSNRFANPPQQKILLDDGQKPPRPYLVSM